MLAKLLQEWEANSTRNLMQDGSDRNHTAAKQRALNLHRTKFPQIMLQALFCNPVSTTSDSSNHQQPRLKFQYQQKYAVARNHTYMNTGGCLTQLDANVNLSSNQQVSSSTSDEERYRHQLEPKRLYRSLTLTLAASVSTPASTPHLRRY